MADTQRSPYANDDYTVGWICALPHEFAAAKGMLDEELGEPQTVQSNADDNQYFLGSIGKLKVVVACLRLHQNGPTSATSAAKEMLYTFPEIRVGLLVVAVVGVLFDNDDPEIRLSDIVIRSSRKIGGVVVHGFGKQHPGLHETSNNEVSRYINIILDKYPHMREIGYKYRGESLDRLFQPNYPHVSGKACRKYESGQGVRELRVDDAPRIQYGTIAPGGTKIEDQTRRDNIRDKRGAICLNLEAACLMNMSPGVGICGISDYADSQKYDGWQKYPPPPPPPPPQHVLKSSLDVCSQRPWMERLQGRISSLKQGQHS